MDAGHTFIIDEWDRQVQAATVIQVGGKRCCSDYSLDTSSSHSAPCAVSSGPFANSGTNASRLSGPHRMWAAC